MKISDIYQSKKTVLSLEVFPPKKDADIQAIHGVLKEITEVKPDFISVTYGAGGSAQTVERSKYIASQLENNFHTTALSHLTSIGATKQNIKEITQGLREEKVENILALRGDVPAGMSDFPTGEYSVAVDLIADLKQAGDFCVGGACYPEGHLSCMSEEESMEHLKRKQEAGADFFISQLFFDNEVFLRFLEKSHQWGIRVPISGGIMPILSKGQIDRMIYMCGASLPSQIIKLLHRYEHSPQDLSKAGIDYVIEQGRQLIEEGVDGVHLYTMNRPEIAQQAMKVFYDNVGDNQ